MSDPGQTGKADNPTFGAAHRQEDDAAATGREYRMQQARQPERQGSQKHAKERWYGVQETANFLGLHRSTLHLAIQRGRLTPDLRTPGGHARFRRATLEAFQRRLVAEAATSEVSVFAPAQVMATLASLIASAQPLRAICQAAVNGIIAVEPDVMCCIVFRVTDQIDQLDQGSQSDQSDERLLGQRGSPSALRLYASQGFPRRFFRTYTLLRTQTSASFATLSVLRTREAEFCDDIAQSEEVYPYSGTRRLLEEMGMRAYGVAPIVVTGRAVGALIVGSKLPHHFSLHERVFVQGITDQLASAVRMQRGRRRNESDMQAARTLLAQVFSRRAAGGRTAPAPAQSALAGIEGEQEEQPEGQRHKSPMAPLVMLLTQQTGAIQVCALGFGASVQGDSLDECSVNLLELACDASAGDALAQRHWRDDAGATSTGLALSIPLAGGSGKRGAVVALWQGIHTPTEGDKLLLMAFAGACALLAEEG
ncbi:MAG: GAF domain-containing protein [Ktedonobacterales bacterium]